jgi:hypothetical protein
MELALLKTPPLGPGDTHFSRWDQSLLNSWLESLPRGDALGFGQALHAALQTLNRTTLSRLNRYELSERLRPVVNDAATMLISRYRASSLPLTEQAQADANLVQQLYAELATSFKIAVNEEIAGHAKPGRDRTPLQLATQRALLCLGRVLLECYRVYAPEPPLLWRDIHTLYRNSERARLQGLPIYRAPDSDETALAIKQAYLRIAVLALSNPYHLMQGEAEELYRRIGRWIHFVQLTPPDSSGVNGKFVIDLDSDLPARYIGRSVPAIPRGELRVLNLQALVDAIDEQIAHATAQLANHPTAVTLSMRMQRDMYLRFHSALDGRPERRSERKSTMARLMVAKGFTACHFLLNDRQAFTPEDDEAEARAAASTGPSRQAPTLTLLDDSQPLPPAKGSDTCRTSRFHGFDADADDVWRKATLIAAPPEPEQKLQATAVQWNRKNESDGGMALFCARNCPMQVRVGELLAFAEDEAAAASAWRIGAIRWLRTRPNGGLEMGVQRIADSGYAVGTQALSGAGKGSEYLRGILVPRQDPIGETTSLLSPASIYDVDSVVRLRLERRVVHVRLTELLEATRLFAHFRVQPVDHGAA